MLSSLSGTIRINLYINYSGPYRDMSIKDYISDQIHLDKRGSHRFIMNLRAQVFIKHQSTRHDDCIIIDTSARGAQIHLHLSKKIPLGSKVFLDIVTSFSLEHVTLCGTIMHIDRLRNIYGIKFDKMIDSDTLSKIRERPRLGQSASVPLHNHP